MHMHMHTIPNANANANQNKNDNKIKEHNKISKLNETKHEKSNAIKLKSTCK